MAEVTDRHRVYALASLLMRAVHETGLSFDAPPLGLKDACAVILTAARCGGRLDPRTYRAIWWVWNRVHRGEGAHG